MKQKEFDHRIKTLHQYEKKSPGRIDRQTSTDLELERLFEQLDSTYSLQGQNYLYHRLHTPFTNEKEIRKQENERKEIGNFPFLEKILKKAGTQKYGNLLDELINPYPVDTRKYKGILRFWIAFTLLSFTAPFLLGIGFVLLPFVILVINVALHIKLSPHIGGRIRNLTAFFKMLRTLKEIIKITESSTLPLFSELRNEFDEIKGVLHHQAFLIHRSSGAAGDLVDMFIEYFRIFLLQEIYSFVSSYDTLREKAPLFIELYRKAGKIDFLISLNSLTAESDLPLCHPDFNSSGKLRFENMVHPLIEGCVGNSLDIDKGIILTGTNMAGKSSFLRTIGINQVLATTLGFCHAQSFQTDFFPVYSAINTSDSLADNKSRYFSEAERLNQLIGKAREKDYRGLILIDEILSGTNNTERIKAAKAILRSLTSSKSLVLAATHDLEIARDLDELYQNYHFSESVEDGTLNFDYTIKPGIVNSRNAIRILEYLNFPDEILDEIR